MRRSLRLYPSCELHELLVFKHHTPLRFNTLRMSSRTRLLVDLCPGGPGDPDPAITEVENTPEMPTGRLWRPVFVGIEFLGSARKWLRGLDLNQRPLGYEPNELPGCSTPQNQFINIL